METGNNPKLNLVNINVHTKFDQIMSIYFQDIERKQNSDINQGPNSLKILHTIMGNNLKLDLVMLMCMKNFVRTYQFILKLLSGNKIFTESGNDRTMEGQGESSIAH